MTTPRAVISMGPTWGNSARIEITALGEEDDEHGVPFTEEDLNIIRRDAPSDHDAEMLFIMCLSGYRVAAYSSMEVSLEEGYFKGGVKTAAGKGRIVPIHSAILQLVAARVEREGALFPDSVSGFRKRMYAYLQRAGIEKHTPHDCRHTFSALCEKYGVREADRKRMLGHSFQGDITNAVYGHRSLDELREEIEKIHILPPT